MPILKNAIKKMRQDAKKTQRNKAKRTTLKTAIKKARMSTDSQNLSLAFSKLDKAAKSHLIHKKKAARLKSRLAKAVAKLAPKEEKKDAKATKPAGAKTTKPQSPRDRKTATSTE